MKQKFKHKGMLIRIANDISGQDRFTKKEIQDALKDGSAVIDKKGFILYKPQTNKIMGQVEKFEDYKFSYNVEKCLEAPTSQESFNDLSNFLENLLVLDGTASKQTHYNGLEEWSDAVHKYVKNKLDKYGFVNASMNQTDDAAFWWLMYQVVSSAYCSVHMKSKVAQHHSSAWERNQALMADIEDIITFKELETIK